MSQYSRMASTDEQENSIKEVENAFKQNSIRIAGATVIGRSPQTVILDVHYHGSEIYVNPDGEITIQDEQFYSVDSMAGKIKQIKETPQN